MSINTFVAPSREFFKQLTETHKALDRYQSLKFAIDKQ